MVSREENLHGTSNPVETICVDINDLRMRINLQHRECFPLAAVGVKRFIY